MNATDDPFRLGPAPRPVLYDVAAAPARRALQPEVGQALVSYEAIAITGEGGLHGGLVQSHRRRSSLTTFLSKRIVSSIR